jgi:uncharacterized membrane protein YfcA
MHDITLVAQMCALLLVVGGFAGLLAGLLGVGGGVVLVPAFYYAFDTLGLGGDTLMQVCVATSLATIVVTSARSVLSHNRQGAVEWPILKGWATGIVIGAVLGTLVVAQLRTQTLQLIFAVLGLCVAAYLGIGKSQWRLGEAMPKGIKRAIVSPLIGFLSVLVGIGGGSMGVPLMTLYGVPMHRAVATAAGFGFLIAAPSVLGFLLLATEATRAIPFTIGSVNYAAVLLVISMTLLTAPLGARLAHRTDAVRLRRIFAGFVAVVALNMARKAFVG